MPAKQPKDLTETFKGVVDEVNKIIVPAGNRESIDSVDRENYEEELSLQRSRAKTDKSNPLPFGMEAENTSRGNCQEFAELTLYKLLQLPDCRCVDYYICQASANFGTDAHIFIVASTHAEGKATYAQAVKSTDVCSKEGDYIIIDCWSRMVYEAKKITDKKMAGEAQSAYKVRGDMGSAKLWAVQWTWDGSTLNYLPDYEHVKKWTPRVGYKKYSSGNLEFTPMAIKHLNKQVVNLPNTAINDAIEKQLGKQKTTPTFKFIKEHQKKKEVKVATTPDVQENSYSSVKPDGW